MSRYLVRLLRLLEGRAADAANAITDQRCAYIKIDPDDPDYRRRCEEYPGTGRHMDECPLGTICPNPEEHHPWQKPHWWSKPDVGEVMWP